MESLDLPLTGLVVVDMGRFIAAPFCALLLGQLGARVIKLEKLAGDDSRRSGPFVGSTSLYFESYNGSKESVAVDFRHERGRDLVRKVLQHCDVVVENFRPGTMDAMGLSFGVLCELNPGIIMTSVSGFGQDGPYSGRAAFDAIAQAMSGLMSLTGTEEGQPLLSGAFVADYSAGLYATVATLAALYGRSKDGCGGRHIDVSLLESAVSLLGPGLTDFLTTGRGQARTGNRDRISAPANAFPTRDGWVYLHAGTDALWQRLCSAMGSSGLVDNPEFASQAARLLRAAAVEAVVARWTRQMTSREVEDAGRRFGFPCARVAGLPEVAGDDQLRFRGAWVGYSGADSGEVRSFGGALATAFGRSLGRGRGPALGEHTVRVLRDMVGLREDEVSELAQAGIIGTLGA